jgi:PiT family inorganic phosphate transporter
MAERPPALKKTALDKDLKKIGKLQSAMRETGEGAVKIGLALVFLACVGVFSALYLGGQPNAAFVIAAAVIGGYMALNIGANDVANNVGPAVGSKALTMAGALIIAAVFEAAGAIIAGGDVVSTIRKGIISGDAIGDVSMFMTAMMAALLAAALWLNLATWIGAPVSTTHSIVGGVMGAGIAAAGLSAVSWGTMAKIAASWVISPVLGGVIAALFLYFIKRAVLFQDDMIAAARRWVPVIVAIMAAAFSMYLVMKGLKKIWKPGPEMVWLVGLLAFVVAWGIVRPLVARASVGLENRRKSVAGLFVIPLIVSAALLSFAHGANDVANAVGPLAAIVGSASQGAVAAKVGIPLWVMVIGAIGIAAGLMLFGPKLVRKVGEQITKLNPIRAFCVALSAAITVLIASALGLPVSSTHIAVGGVFGVGFLREFISNRRRVDRPGEEPDIPPSPTDPAAQARESGIAAKLEAHVDAERMEKKARKAIRRRLVRRQHLLTIAAAWVITVPLAALLSAGLFYVLNTLQEF